VQSIAEEVMRVIYILCSEHERDRLMTGPWSAPSILLTGGLVFSLMPW